MPVSRTHLFGYVLAALALTACQTSDIDPTQPAVSSATANLIEKECAVYLAIDAQLLTEGRAKRTPVAEGCPQSAVSGDITALEPAPEISDPKAKTFYRKMIVRGAPEDIAQQASRSSAFINWLEAARLARN